MKRIMLTMLVLVPVVFLIGCGVLVERYPPPIFTQPAEPNGLKEAREWCAAENKWRKREEKFWYGLSDRERFYFSCSITDSNLTIVLERLERLTAPEQDLPPDVIRERNLFYSKENLEEYKAIIKQKLDLGPMPELPNGYVVWDLRDEDWDPQIMTVRKKDEITARMRIIGGMNREKFDEEFQRRLLRDRLGRIEDTLYRLEQKVFEKELEDR